jgi:RNase H-like domain found in reverse transcriptase
MHFLIDNDPIYLHADASDYGIGGYLFQLIDGKEVPIAFVSKSFTLVQLRWAVIKKETFAIYYCCIFLKTLLRDRTFTICGGQFQHCGCVLGLRSLGVGTDADFRQGIKD